MKEKYKRNLLLRNEYVSNNEWNIPLVKKQDIDLKQLDFLSFDQVSKERKADDAFKTIHFFKDDYKLEGLYNRCEANLVKLARFRNVLTPDYSLYRDMPLALQLQNTFKNRWCGAYWQEHGLNVITSISWSDERSYEFCFLGVEKESVVAVSTLGVRRHEEGKKWFLKGYYEMQKQLEPHTIICYDEPFGEMTGDILYVPYERRAS